MLQQVNWQLEDYAFFRKCGEITVSPDEKCFGFNCGLCPAICLQFEVFVQHLREQHDMNQSTQEIEQGTQTNVMIMDMGLSVANTNNLLNSTYKHNNIKKCNTNEFIMKAPLTPTTNIIETANTQTYYTQSLTETTNSNIVKVANTDSELLDIGLALLQDINSKAHPVASVLQQTEATKVEHDFVYIMDGCPSMATERHFEQVKCVVQEAARLQTNSDNDLCQLFNDVVLVAQVTQQQQQQQQIPTITHKNVTATLVSPNDAATPTLIVDKQVPHTLISKDMVSVAAAHTQGLILERNDDQQSDNMNVQVVSEPKLQDIAPPTPPATPKESAMPSLSPTLSMKRTRITTRAMSASTVAASTTVENSTKPLCLRELERNKEIVSYLIAAYERHEKLWNPKHPEYKYNAKRNVYNELSAPLERDLNIKVDGAEIFAVLKELRGRYRRELTKVNNLGAKYKTRLWFFEKMHFLRSIIEKKRAGREVKTSAESTETEKSYEIDSEPTKSLQNREALSYILDAFKRQECLWNPQHYDYVNCNKKELYRDISTQLYEDLNVTMSGEECFKEIQKLRTRYRKELRIMIKHKGLYIPKLWCFDEMEFLHKIFEEQIFTRISKKQGIIDTAPKSKFIDAVCIKFKDINEELQFVEIYKKYPALWEVDHPDYRSTAYRNKAIAQMLEELNTTFDTDSTAEQLEKTLFQLRKDYSAEKHKILTNNTALSTPTASLVHAKLTEFLEENLGPFRCDVCQKLVKTSDQYKVHRAEHDGTQPFICTLCGKGFQMPCNLTVHIRRHRRDFPYACEKCDKRFATSTEVVIHMRTHTGERPYICDLCGKSFKTWSFFDIHRRTHLNQSTFHCPICDKGFYEKNRFTDHMNGHLNIRKHLCKVCGKTFTTYGNLRKHNELHLIVKKYKCATCGKRFAQFASLRWHKKKQHSSSN